MPLDLQPGDRYDDAFEIVSQLGSGTFAKVYEVRAKGHARNRALKISREALSDSASGLRAQREVLIMKKLSSPHIPHCYDAGIRNDGRAYILMERLHGKALDQWFTFDRPLHPAQAVTLIHQVCFGLAQAHRHGIVHRDVKPENIFIEDTGRVRMLDFGLARSFDGSPIIGEDASATHLIAGTPHYCQPEQLVTRRLTPASDVYSLGMILYELISAHSPFHPDRPLPEVRNALIEDPTQWLFSHRDAKVVPIRRHHGCENLPHALVAVIERMLDKNPSVRPPDCAAAANILGHLLHHTLEIPVAGKLEIVHPDHSVEERCLIPGHHSIGSGARSSITLRDDAIPTRAAVLEWGGTPQKPRLRPLDQSSILRVNDTPVHRAVELQEGDQVQIGPFALRFRLQEQVDSRHSA